MKVYVAGKFQDRTKVRGLMDKLEGLGHEITFDWTIEHYAKKEETIEDAVECLQGVIDAEVYVGLFVEDHIYKGALVELGIALTSNILVYLIGHAIDSTIFTLLADKKFENEEEFLDYIGGEL